MSRDWKLTAEQLQDMLLVRKVVISPLIGEELEEDEASESTGSGRTEEIIEDSEVHKTPREK
ncbi:MAG: hypothetical protein HQ498_12160 [Pseudohongiella sp.]|nr:hypothetical protein [Pseudohongiella sp.]